MLNPLPGSTPDLDLGLLEQDFPELLLQYLLHWLLTFSNNIFSCYQLCKSVKNYQCFRDHLCPYHKGLM
jgi:hypothetical protein